MVYSKSSLQQRIVQAGTRAQKQRLVFFLETISRLVDMETGVYLPAQPIDPLSFIEADLLVVLWHGPSEQVEALLQSRAERKETTLIFLENHDDTTFPRNHFSAYESITVVDTEDLILKIQEFLGHTVQV